LKLIVAAASVRSRRMTEPDNRLVAAVQKRVERNMRDEDEVTILVELIKKQHEDILSLKARVSVLEARIEFRDTRGGNNRRRPFNQNGRHDAKQG
jgi:hypothetical protein